MHGKEENGFVALKLDSGEDIFECLRKAIRTFDIKSGYVLLGVGMLRDVDIGYFAGDEYFDVHLEEPHELITLQGSISTKDEVVIHLHCSLAGKDHNIIGGHLHKGTVNVINEILIRKSGLLITTDLHESFLFDPAGIHTTGIRNQSRLLWF